MAEPTATDVVENKVAAPSVFDEIRGIVSSLAEDLPESNLASNISVRAGEVNIISDAWPIWNTNDLESLDADPDRKIPMYFILDLRRAKMTVTAARAFKQRTAEAKAADIDVHAAKPEDLHHQMEFDVMIHTENPTDPRSRMVYLCAADADPEDENNWNPHPMYEVNEFARMRSRGLVIYARTPFDPPPETMDQVYFEMVERGLEPVIREDGPDLRLYVWNLQAPFRGTNPSAQERLRQQQRSGLDIPYVELLGPRATRYEGRPEFMGFCDALIRNMRGTSILAAALKANDEDPNNAFRLATSLTGIDRSGERLEGNALRAVIRGMNFAAPLPSDELCRKTLGWPPEMPINDPIRHNVVQMLKANGSQLLTERELNFFNTSGSDTTPIVVPTPTAAASF